MRNGGEAYVWCLNVSGWQARRGRHVVESAPFRGTSEACSLRIHTLPYTQHVLHFASALVLESTALTSEIPPMRRRIANLLGYLHLHRPRRSHGVAPRLRHQLYAHHHPPPVPALAPNPWYSCNYKGDLRWSTSPPSTSGVMA